VALSNGTLWSNKSGSIKERAQTIDNYVLWGVPEVPMHKLGN